jgi:hypothetical protein
MVGLGALPGGEFHSTARAVSADGSVIVGRGITSFDQPNDEAFIWDEMNGMRRVEDVLTDAGLDLTGWKLKSAHGVSDDGNVIGGWGINPAGSEEGWIAQLAVSPVPEPTILALDIKPGPSKNTVSLNGNGTLQMAILASADFNVSEVDIDSLLFGDPILVDGGATPLGTTSDKLRDINHDGLDDLLVGFSISDLVDGGALAASSVEGRLMGELLDGTPIVGSDIIRMVPQNNGGGGLVISTVPEPGSCVLALAALCLAMCRRRGW